MVLVISLSLNLLLLIFTVMQRKTLHWIELALVWFVVTFIHHTFYFIVTFNLELWKSTNRLDLFWAFVFTRFIGIPLLFMWFFELYWRFPSVTRRGGLIILFCSVMVVINNTMEYAKMFLYIKWSVWLSYGEWLFIVAISLLLLHRFHSILRKEAIL